ncbi:hypothetical protein THII_1702 [Thioploca ingrica]|uniref:Glycosyltransferase 2-like domain-containing protein n=1 Tax=Thioploca ingrica TaxID=40754 RepID=A0A090AFX6_9GAMM|nr:hypothetical protein THII_1702 [Thioploca ingrica]
MKTITLTIGIPTYNRPQALERRLNEIKKFHNLIDEVVICDNSPQILPSLAQAVQELSKCHYYKNSGNIGGGANFLRVVEHAKSDYVWWRGDDDVISENQIQSVHAYLSTTPRLILLSTNVKAPFIGKGIKTFVENFPVVRTFGWLSAIVLPTQFAQKSLRWGYFGIASGWANVALILGLFREYPDLEFVVVPISLQDGEFRDVDRKEGLRWSLFRTCIKQFPLTAQVLESEQLRKIYLAKWRTTHGFHWIKTMVRFKLGYMPQEKITLATFFPFISIRNLRTTILAIILWIMANIPRLAYQLTFAYIWFYLDDKTKQKLELDFLSGCENYWQVFKALRVNKGYVSTDGFI